MTASLECYVAPEIKKAEQVTIGITVYESYDPIEYPRRGEFGGLSDMDNMQEVVVGTKLIIRNVTPPSDYFTPCKYDIEPAPVYSLPHLIEYGDGNGGYYSHPHSAFYPFGLPPFLAPRPFTAETRKNVAKWKMHFHALAQGLEDFGLKVEK